MSSKIDYMRAILSARYAKRMDDLSIPLVNNDENKDTTQEPESFAPAVEDSDSESDSVNDFGTVNYSDIIDDPDTIDRSDIVDDSDSDNESYVTAPEYLASNVDASDDSESEYLSSEEDSSDNTDAASEVIYTPTPTPPSEPADWYWVMIWRAEDDNPIPHKHQIPWEADFYIAARLYPDAMVYVTLDSSQIFPRYDDSVHVHVFISKMSPCPCCFRLMGTREGEQGLRWCFEYRWPNICGFMLFGPGKPFEGMY